uniref:Uncharacterized protein n=1 Tax=Oryza meridionalis TaxID=40149 RepID=A0A0E0CYC7_9ORYZ
MASSSASPRLSSAPAAAATFAICCAASAAFVDASGQVAEKNALVIAATMGADDINRPFLVRLLSEIRLGVRGGRQSQAAIGEDTPGRLGGESTRKTTARRWPAEIDLRHSREERNKMGCRGGGNSAACHTGSDGSSWDPQSAREPEFDELDIFGACSYSEMGSTCPCILRLATPPRPTHDSQGRKSTRKTPSKQAHRPRRSRRRGQGDDHPPRRCRVPPRFLYEFQLRRESATAAAAATATSLA